MAHAFFWLLRVSDLGLTGDFEFDDGGVWVGGFLGNFELNAVGRFFEFQSLAVGQKRGGFDLVLEAGDEEFAVFWPFKDMEVERGDVVLLLLGAAAPREFRKRVGLGAINRLAIYLHPLADVFQTLDAGLGDEAFGCGADIEEVVAAFAGDVDELLNEGF